MRWPAFLELAFDAPGDDMFRELVIARVVEPTSLSDLDQMRDRFRV